MKIKAEDLLGTDSQTSLCLDFVRWLAGMATSLEWMSEGKGRHWRYQKNNFY